jgi:hypothetical protein
MRLTAALSLVGAIAFLAAQASAQFSPAFPQNASYWRDGKSEVDFYNADFVREGRHYQAEVLLVLTAELANPNDFTRADDAKTPGALSVVRINVEASIPRGLLLEQISLDAWWKTDAMALGRLSCTGSDGFGHFAQSIDEKRDGAVTSWKYSCDTYRSKVDRPSLPQPGGVAVFYDELPLRVRTMDFSKPNGSFEIQLARTLINAKDEEIAFKPATISYKVEERSITVEVKRETLIDRFVVDRDFPFLLREWKAADGSQWKLKTSIKADLASYTKPGDRERALKDPMLRHPD